MLLKSEIRTSHISASITKERGIQGKVTSLVTEVAANMTASVRSLNLRHALCFAHSEFSSEEVS